MIQPTAPSLSAPPSLLVPAPVGDGVAFTVSLATMLDHALPCGLPLAAAGKALPAAQGHPLLQTTPAIVEPVAQPRARGSAIATLPFLPGDGESARARPAPAAVAAPVMLALLVEPFAPVAPEMRAAVVTAPVPPVAAPWRMAAVHPAPAPIAVEALPGASAIDTPPRDAPAAGEIGTAGARPAMTASLRATASRSVMAAGLVADPSAARQPEQRVAPPKGSGVTTPTIAPVPSAPPLIVGATMPAITKPDAPADDAVDGMPVAPEDAVANAAPIATQPVSPPADVRVATSPDAQAAQPIAVAPPPAAVATPAATRSGTMRHAVADRAPARPTFGFTPAERPLARSMKPQQPEQGIEPGLELEPSTPDPSAEQPALAPAPAGSEALAIPIRPPVATPIAEPTLPTRAPGAAVTPVSAPVRHSASVPPPDGAPEALQPAPPAAALLDGSPEPARSRAEAGTALQIVAPFAIPEPVPIDSPATALPIASPATIGAANVHAPLSRSVAQPLPGHYSPTPPPSPAFAAHVHRAPAVVHSGRRNPPAGTDGGVTAPFKSPALPTTPVLRPLADSPPQAALATRVEPDLALPVTTGTRQSEARALSHDSHAPLPIRVAFPQADPLPLVAGASAPAFRMFAAAIHAARTDDAASVPVVAAAISQAEQVRAPLAATGAVSAPLDMTERAWPQTMVDRIDTLREAASAVRDAASTSIRLVPDALGTIDVSVRNVGDTVQVHFTAAQPETRALLADAQPRLTELAEARGIKLAQGDIGLGGQGVGQGQQHGQRPPAPQSTNRSAPAPSASDGEPELTTIRIA